MFWYVILIFFSSFIASLFLIFLKHQRNHHNSFLHYMDDFTDGVFLGLACFDMVPHALEHAAHANISPVVIIFSVILVALLFIYIYGIFSNNLNTENNDVLCCPVKSNADFCLSLIFLLSFHSLFEGIAFGMVNDLSFRFLLFICIFMHKGLESMAFTNAFLLVVKNKIMAVIFVLFYALLTPMGVLLGMLFNDLHILGDVVTITLNIITSGMFLYMGLNCILKTKNQLISSEFFAFILGVILVACLNFMFHNIDFLHALHG